MCAATLPQRSQGGQQNLTPIELKMEVTYKSSDPTQNAKMGPEAPRLPQFDRDAASTRAHIGANNQITAGPSLWGPAAERANRASALSNL